MSDELIGLKAYGELSEAEAEAEYGKIIFVRGPSAADERDAQEAHDLACYRQSMISSEYGG